jgi:hypothetical protein
MIKLLAEAKYLGLDEQRRQRGGTPAIIEIDDVRFFSLNARSDEDVARINAAAKKLIEPKGTQ